MIQLELAQLMIQLEFAQLLEIYFKIYYITMLLGNQLIKHVSSMKLSLKRIDSVNLRIFIKNREILSFKMTHIVNNTVSYAWHQLIAYTDQK